MTTTSSGSVNWSKSFTMQITKTPSGRDVAYERITPTGKTITGEVKTAATADGGVKVSASRTDRLGTTKSAEAAYSAEQVETFKDALRDRIVNGPAARETWPIEAPPARMINPAGGFTVYYDEETGQVVCGMPPRLPDGTILPYGGDTKETKPASAKIDTGMPQCLAAETI